MILVIVKISLHIFRLATPVDGIKRKPDSLGAAFECDTPATTGVGRPVVLLDQCVTRTHNEVNLYRGSDMQGILTAGHHHHVKFVAIGACGLRGRLAH